MELHTIRTDLGSNARKLREDLVHDLKAEAAHVTDPAQCGYVVRRHFDGIVFALLAFILLFVAAAAAAIYFYTQLHR